ncbi:MAG: glycine dehydrogenase subunit 2, partial [Deltaproteobacteria bacterium]|nr:glycine dehydrogenase subunit 2 [Deltaproteobacteria bacterium]
MSGDSAGSSRRGSAPPLLFESGSPGRSGFFWPEPAGAAWEGIPEKYLREDIPGFPELGELEVLRHFTRLSHLNYAIETHFYPLGSCTMKYNPKVNEAVARLPGFSRLHPLAPPELLQGALELLYGLERMLAEISGMDQVTLQPAAGAHGELTGLMLIRAHHRDQGNPRRKIIVPDTAHGTNPASSTLGGYEVIQVASNARGIIEAAKVAEIMTEEVAALMITNPNTLGLFESEIEAVADVVHAKGGLLYLDGANLNALMGIAKPYLPLPRIVEGEGGFSLREDLPKSIGRVRSFFGNFGVLVRAYTYIISLGSDGLEEASRMALLNANYVKKRLAGTFHLPYPEPCMHECVLTDRFQQRHGVSTLDIAKRLLDYGFHPPTIYFPLVVPGAIMIEPTET